MKQLLDLPRTIMPAEFFDQVAAALASEEVPPGAPDDRTMIHLHGAGGGTWNAGFVDGRMTLVDGPVDEAPLQITLTVSDWREFVAGRVRDVIKDAAPDHAPDLTAIGHLYSSEEKVETLRAFAGDIQAIVEDAEEDAEYIATFTLGGGTPDATDPTTTIRVGLDALSRLASGAENIQTAFFSGSIRIDGDMNLAMGLMTAMMA